MANNTYPVEPSQPLTGKDVEKLKEKKQQPEFPEYKREKERVKPKLDEAKFTRKKREQRVRPLLRYFNTNLLIPINRGQLIPGNVYCFNYSNWKHSPVPMVFYIGTNPHYGTLEGINLQYLSIPERERLIQYFRKTPLHSDKMLKGSLKIKDLMGRDRHIFKRSYSSDSLYHYLRKKLGANIYLYRRYKLSKISSHLYVMPIEALYKGVSISTPLRTINPRVLEESKKKFANIINKLRK